jgi:hypothetical protein
MRRLWVEHGALRFVILGLDPRNHAGRARVRGDAGRALFAKPSQVAGRFRHGIPSSAPSLRSAPAEDKESVKRKFAKAGAARRSPEFPVMEETEVLLRSIGLRGVRRRLPRSIDQETEVNVSDETKICSE